MTTSNRRARALWNERAVGEQRARSSKGSCGYFAEIRRYRYGYETPWIPRLFRFAEMTGCSILEIGVGNGIDAVEMCKNGAKYVGLDITDAHLELTAKNFTCNHLPPPHLIREDLLRVNLDQQFDVIYSFGVLHHISHESDYLARFAQALANDGELRIAVYSTYSFFNLYLLLSWLFVDRMRHTRVDWASHIAERSTLGSPVTVKIRSRREVTALLEAAGFEVIRYWKRGFVQNYLPLVGRFVKPDGLVLNVLGSLLGWYHIFHCRVNKPQLAVK